MARQELVAKDFFTALPFWDKLERAEQQAVQRETRELAEAHAGQVVSRIKMGEHLTALQDTLEGKGYFVRYLNTLNFSYRTAYRYIEAYKAVKDQVPEIALRIAAARGMDLVGYQADRPFGAYTEPIKQLPPPSEASAVPEWLDKIEAKRLELPKKARAPRAVSGETSLKHSYRSVTARFKRVAAGKGRVALLKRLIGFLMADFGIPAQNMEPEAPPEDFRAKVGRPKKRPARDMAAD